MKKLAAKAINLISTLSCISIFVLPITASAVTQISDFQEKPKIIALAPHIVETLYALGAGDQIIGTTDYADYPEQAKDIPRVGNAIKLQLEKIIAMQPDLVIAWKSGNPPEELERLKALGITVEYSQPDTFEQLADEIIRFGNLVKQETKAKQLAQQLLADLAQLKNAHQDKAPITVFYEIWPQPLTTVAKGSWPQQHLDICQAKNPFYQAITGYPQVSIEHAVSQNIEVIIQPSSKHSNEKLGYNWQQWQHLPAVKNQQFISPNADALHRMTPRSLLEVKNLCQQLDKARAFYQQIKSKRK